MPIVSDFVVIQGDITRRIGDRATLWEKTFDTVGRAHGGLAILTFMVKGLIHTESNVDVKINGKHVGRIFNYKDADPNHWFTQIMTIGSNILNDGENKIHIEAVSYPSSESGDIFEDFYIRDVVCFFKQELE